MAYFAADAALTSTELICMEIGNPITELQSVACHMGSHSVTCHPTQANPARLNPVRLVLDLLTLERWKAELT